MRGKTPFLLIVIGCLVVLAASVLVVRFQSSRSRSPGPSQVPDAGPQAGAAGTNLTGRERWYARLGTNVNKLDKGYSPLIWSVRFDEFSIVKRLIEEKGADVNLPDFQGQTPLMWAARSGDAKTNIVKLLLEHRANVNARDDMGNGALDMARSKEVVKLLEQAGATENIFGPVGRADLEAVKHAIAQGSDVNVRDSEQGQTPLMVALADGDTEIATLLVEKGADVNAKNNAGWTPLIYAMGGGDKNTNIVKLMIAKGADVNAKDNSGKTMLQWAEQSSRAGISRPGIAKLLKEAGAKE